MALESTTLTPAPQVFPYSGITEPVRDRSNVPFAEIVYSVLTEDVTAAGVGDNQFLTINCLLPVNFAYVLIDASLQVENSTTGTFDWNPSCQMGITDAISGIANRLYSPNYEGISNDVIFDGNFGVAERRSYRFPEKPKYVIQAQPGQQARIAFTLGNPTTNGQAAKATLLVRCLMYGVSQRHHYQVNTPVPVR